jgi:hypothetical protein
MIRTTGLDHIHVNVRDLTAFVDLFDRLFGTGQAAQVEVEAVAAFNATVRFSPEAPSTFLDVFEPVGEQGPVAEAIRRHDECVTILSFRVEDLDQAADHAISCGLREVSRVGFPGVMKQIQFHPADTPGFQVEFVEYEAGHELYLSAIKQRMDAAEDVPGLRFRGRAGDPK